MASPLKQLIASGSKLWLDSVDPDLIAHNRSLGATGATSNPIIIADLIKSGRYDGRMRELAGSLSDPEEIAWQLTDEIVSEAEKTFLPIWDQSRGNDGYVSFELDPLVEDATELSIAQKAERYVYLAKKWSKGHPNRMIKVPATPGGIKALAGITAAGIPVNVTLIFSADQYRSARQACLEGITTAGQSDSFKSVYSIFVSRLDVYSEVHVPELSAQAQGQVGIVNAKRVWQENEKFWQEHPRRLAQEIIFASTGTKKPEDPPYKYVLAFAGSGIETNPPATNEAVEKSQVTITRSIDRMPSAEILREIDNKVDFKHLEETLMREGLEKFSVPQQGLIKLIAERCS